MKIRTILIIVSTLVIMSCNTNKPTHGDNYEFSVMSFNIRYDNWEDGENKWSNRREACIEMINELDPYVFGIQEGLEHQLAYLQDTLTQYEHVGIGRDLGIYYDNGEYCAVFYKKNRFELVNDSTFWLSETPNEVSVGWDAACRRIVTWVHLLDTLHQENLYVFNTHFDHVGKDARKNSATLLMDKIGEITEEGIPVFITGDFNALITNTLFDTILVNFENTRSSAEYSDNHGTCNYWGKFFATKIDHIFHKNATALTFKTVNDDYGVPYISDHYPVFATFRYSE